MKNITIRLADIARASIPIGYEGEQNHTRVTFYCAEVFDSYPDAVGTMVIKPTVGDVYPQAVERDGSKLIWDVTASNCASAGAGTFQFTFTQDNEIIKTVIGSFSVNSSIVGSGEPPEPVTDWVNGANEKLTEVEQAIQTISRKYVKPVNGIPASDLSSAVQESLGKADTALQGTDVTESVDEWLEDNFTNPSNPPLDRSLTSSSSAAPADMVGAIKNGISVIGTTLVINF